MGYNSRMEGGFDIVPALGHLDIQRIRDKPVRPGNPDGDDGNIFTGSWATFRIVTDDHTEVTPRGTLFYVTASRVEPHEESAKWRHIEDDLQFVVDSIGSGHVLRGVVEVQGAESDDTWRVFVRGGKVVRQDAVRVWPDLPDEDPGPGSVEGLERRAHQAAFGE